MHRAVFTAAAYVGTVLAIVLPAAAEQPAAIHPLVLQQTASGGSAEFLVVLEDGADLEPASRLATKEERGRFVVNALRQTAAQSQTELLKWLESRQIPHRAFYIVNAVLVEGDAAVVASIAARPEVKSIEANPTIHNPLPTSMPAQSSPEAIEWGITRTHAPQVWDLGHTGQGIVVGGQDTGIDWDHPALINQYRGWNGSSADHDYNWHDAIHSAVGNPCGSDSSEPCDDYGHGTHTVGTAVGGDGGTNQIGMAPGAKWIGCRNMDNGNGTPARYLECLEFFLAPYPVGGTPAQGDPAKAPDLTTNSWACPAFEGCSWDTLQAAIDAQVAAGIMTIVSAGNSGSSCGTVSSPPAIYASTVAVGSTTSADSMSGFSSRGPATANQGNPALMKPALVAPGSSIRSAVPGGGYGSMSGTSMASPHVAGAATLLWSARPDLKGKPEVTRTLLEDTAQPLPGIVESCGGDYVNGPNNTWGHGMVDILAAVETGIDISLAPVSATVEDLGGNGVVEPGEVATLKPSWTNVGTDPAPTVTGTATSPDALIFGADTAEYGTIAPGVTTQCSTCISFLTTGTRPAAHWDVTIDEAMSTDDSTTWTAHIGESFTDVPPGQWAYRHVETVLHNGITAGCTGTEYCPSDEVNRWQMAAFLARAMTAGAEIPVTGTVPGAGDYDCSPGGSSIFDDVPADDPGCRHIHYIAAEGVTSGCSATEYCPETIVSRWQMGVFLAQAMTGDDAIPASGTVDGLGSYNCSPGGTSVFTDVLPEDPGCAAIHYVAREGVTAGCGGGLYCAADDVMRDQMAVFLTLAFGLGL